MFLQLVNFLVLSVHLRFLISRLLSQSIAELLHSLHRTIQEISFL